MGAQGNLPSETETAGILNLFLYLDYKEADAGLPLSQIMNEIRNNDAYWNNHQEVSYRRQFQIIQEALAHNPEMGRLEIGLQRYENGVNAAVFQDGNRAYVVYRGTGDGLWIDNGRGMAEAITQAQQGSADFLDEAAEAGGWNENTDLTVTGHSKGGNNAQSSTLNAKNSGLVDRCISFDGQGMSPAGIEYYQNSLGDEYDRRIERMYSVCGANDPVNELGCRIIPEDHVAYIETNTDMDNLIATHALEYLYCRGKDENGNDLFGDTFNGQTEQGVIGRYAARLSELLMRLPDDQREACAVSVMQLIELGEELKTGYNGDHADLTDWITFVDKGIPLVLYSLIITEEGREATGELLVDFIRIYNEKYGNLRTMALVAASLALAPVVITAGFGIWCIADLMEKIRNVWQTAVGILEELGALTEQIVSFLEQCWQAVEAFAEQTKDWIKTHILGRTVFIDSRFSIDTARLYLAAENMRRVCRKFAEAEGRMASIRRSLPYYGIGGTALRAGVGAVEYQVLVQAQKAERLAAVADNTGHKYQQYESEIISRVPDVSAS